MAEEYLWRRWRRLCCWTVLNYNVHVCNWAAIWSLALNANQVYQNADKRVFNSEFSEAKKLNIPTHHLTGIVNLSYEFYLSVQFFNSCRRLPETKRHSSLFLHCSGSIAVVPLPVPAYDTAQPAFTPDSSATRYNTACVHTRQFCHTIQHSLRSHPTVLPHDTAQSARSC